MYSLSNTTKVVAARHDPNHDCRLAKLPTGPLHRPTPLQAPCATNAAPARGRTRTLEWQHQNRGDRRP
eukprot:15137763-Alexandrium_andersonii.AAC.1